MKKIIFVCLGNICRSPMAEFIMKDLIRKNKLEQDFFITSAGTSGEHDGENAHIGTLNKLKNMKIEISNFKSKKLTQDLCNANDMILVMDKSNYNNVINSYFHTKEKTFLITDYCKELNYNHVPDPWYTGNFDETYFILSQACQNLLNTLK